eukprot:COSAG02_NODE_61619_length_268_cov_0.609467_1_plen_50_part_01
MNRRDPTLPHDSAENKAKTTELFSLRPEADCWNALTALAATTMAVAPAIS